VYNDDQKSRQALNRSCSIGGFFTQPKGAPFSAESLSSGEGEPRWPTPKKRRESFDDAAPAWEGDLTSSGFWGGESTGKHRKGKVGRLTRGGRLMVGCSGGRNNSHLLLPEREGAGRVSCAWRNWDQILLSQGNVQLPAENNRDHEDGPKKRKLHHEGKPEDTGLKTFGSWSEETVAKRKEHLPFPQEGEAGPHRR